MLKLIKKDIKISLSNGLSSFMKIGILILITALFLRDNMVEGLIFNIPIFIAYYRFGIYAEKYLSNSYYKLFNSLPVKRWEYVLSEYILMVITYIFTIVYSLMLLKVLSFFGFEHINYININILRESFIMALISFSILFIIFFMLYNIWSLVIGLYVLSVISRNYSYVENGSVLNELIQIIKGSHLLMAILLYLISFGISVWSFGNKDLA